MSSTVYPTGTCFDDAFELIEYFVDLEPAMMHEPRLLLVHGIAHVPDEQPKYGEEAPGEPFAHGWIELNDQVFHKGIHCGVKIGVRRDIDEFYDQLRIEDFTEYRMKDVWRMNQKHRHYGPWVKRYIELCREAKRKRRRQPK